MTLTMADLAGQALPSPQESSGPVPGPRADQPVRRTFTIEYKLRMVAEYETATERGAKGALLRREGLYQSHIRKWSQARDTGTLRAQGKTQTITDPTLTKDTVTQIRRLKAENVRLTKELGRTKAVLDVVGKTHALLEMLSESAD